MNMAGTKTKQKWHRTIQFYKRVKLANKVKVKTYNKVKSQCKYVLNVAANNLPPAFN